MSDFLTRPVVGSYFLW